MTENEAIEELKLIKHTRIFIPSDEVWEMAIKALEEVQKYHEIGMSLEVVEEFKRMDKEQDGELTVMMKSIRELGQYRRLGTVEEIQSMKEKNVLPIATIKFSKEGMQELVDEKVKEIELDIKKIRNKAIDEAIETAAKAICVGCGYLDGKNCTYKGSNCGISKPMLEKVVKALEQMKEGV